MALVTLPTTILAGQLRDAISAVGGMVYTAGRPAYVRTSGRYRTLGSGNMRINNLNQPQLVGLSLTSALADGAPQWIIKRGIITAASGLTPGAAYYAGPGTNAQQTISITGTPTGGTFTLRFINPYDGTDSTTTALAYNLTGPTLQAALEALTSVGAGNVVVTGTNPSFTVEFKLELGDEGMPLFSLQNNSLTGGSTPSVAIATSVAGQGATQIGEFADIPSGDYVIFMGIALSATSLWMDAYFTGVIK